MINVIRRAVQRWREWRLRVTLRKGARLLPREIREQLDHRAIGFDFSRLYRIGVTEYRDNADLEHVREAIHRRDLGYIRKLKTPHAECDHLVVYLLEGNEKAAMLLGIESPFELWDADTIFAVERCSIDDCAGFLDDEVC